MSIEAQGVVDRLVQAVDRLTAATQSIVETQEIQTEMLRRIVEATAVDPLGDLLPQILDGIRVELVMQRAGTRVLRQILQDLPVQLGNAVGAEMRAVLAVPS